MRLFMRVEVGNTAFEIWPFALAMLIVLLLAQPSYAQSEQEPEGFPNPICGHTFERFAYGIPRQGGQYLFAYPPTPTWTLALSVPSDLFPDLPTVENAEPKIYARVVADREYNNQYELWVSVGVRLPDYSVSAFAIYRPATNEWELIPEFAQDPNLMIENVFVTPDGTVWGSNYWWDSQLPAFSSVPVLSRFNEVTRQFELVTNAPMVPVPTPETPMGTPDPKILLDQQGVFWIFNAGSSIYRYDPTTDISEQRADLQEVSPHGVNDVSLAQDGTIYFRNSIGLGYPRPDLSDDAVFQYLPQTGQIVPVTLPEERWPDFRGLYVDSRNWLWLGMVGYRDEAGTWHLLHAAVEEYFDLAGREFVHWAPTIQQETPDGRLWAYLDFVDFARYGLGWYNPITEEGCSLPVSTIRVFEDMNGYVWVGDGDQGQLYRYYAGEEE